MRTLAFIFASALLLVNCTGEPSAISEEQKDQTPSEVSDQSTQEKNDNEEEPDHKIEPSDFSVELSPWIQAWDEFIHGFSMDDLYTVRTKPITKDFVDALENHDDILDVQEQLPFPILFSSADGLRHVYVSPPGISPDSEVALITPEENMYERLLFCGTSCAFDGAFWVGNDTFAITGFSEYYPADEERCTVDTICTVVPTLHVFHLQDGTVTLYEGPEVDADTFYKNGLSLDSGDL